MRRLNGMDAYLLYSETPNLHSHTLKVAVIDAARCDGPRGVCRYEGRIPFPATAANQPPA